jgi:hypothetical protein
MAEYKKLRFGSPEEQSSDEQPTVRGTAPYLGRAQRERDEWLQRANDFLETLDGWDASHEPGTAGFHEKCLMYEGLLVIVPKGSLRHTVFTEYVGFLRESPVERESPAEWAYHLERLLKNQYEENDQADFTRYVSQSGDATMQAFAALIQLTSQTR